MIRIEEGGHWVEVQDLSTDTRSPWWKLRLGNTGSDEEYTYIGDNEEGMRKRLLNWIILLPEFPFCKVVTQ